MDASKIGPNSVEVKKVFPGMLIDFFEYHYMGYVHLRVRLKLARF